MNWIFKGRSITVQAAGTADAQGLNERGSSGSGAKCPGCGAPQAGIEMAYLIPLQSQLAFCLFLPHM